MFNERSANLIAGLDRRIRGHVNLVEILINDEHCTWCRKSMVARNKREVVDLTLVVRGAITPFLAKLNTRCCDSLAVIFQPVSLADLKALGVILFYFNFTRLDNGVTV